MTPSNSSQGMCSDPIPGDIAKQIKANGGRHVTKVDDRVTHLITQRVRVAAGDFKGEDC